MVILDPVKVAVITNTVSDKALQNSQAQQQSYKECIRIWAKDSNKYHPTEDIGPTNKHVKRYWISSFREMHIKAVA